VCERFDEYTVLDVLESLVRKSLLTAESVYGHTRYGMLETIRQFAEERLGAAGTSADVRDRHAAYFAQLAVAHLDVWNGPHYQDVVEWFDVEFANLRAGFRWSADRGDVVVATTIAAHSCVLGQPQQRYEAVGWADEILPAAVAADVPQLPRLYTGVACCLYTGRAEEGLAYAHSAQALQADPRYDPFTDDWASNYETAAYLHSGDTDNALGCCAVLARRPGLSGMFGLSALVFALPAVGRAAEARTMADQALAAARANGNQFWIAWALLAYGRAFADSDPTRALDAMREGLSYARTHRISFAEALIARDAAALEAVHGAPQEALALFDSAIESFHRSGNQADLAATLAYLAIFFDRVEEPRIAATIYGAASRSGSISLVPQLAAAIDHLRAVLGSRAFEDHVATGAVMDAGDAVAYARDQIHATRRQPADGN
jgi:tetratricopeptide (TPR) repeat protein